MSSRSNSIGSNGTERRKSTSFLSKLRPPSLIISKRSQNYNVEAHNYVNDPELLSREDARPTSTLRRDSISLSSVLSTLLRKPDKNSLRRFRDGGGDEFVGSSSTLGVSSSKKSERSKSFNIKCDSKTSPYFEIELMEDKRRRKSLDGYNRRLSISEYAKMFPELLSESSESIASDIPKKVTKTGSFSVNGGGGGGSTYSDYGPLGSSRNRKKIQRSVSSVSELIAPHIPKSDDIVSTRPEGGYEDSNSHLERKRSQSSWIDEAMPSILSSTPKKASSPINSSCSTLSSSSLSMLSPQKTETPSGDSPPGTSKTQELEDYAKQYEDLYSKRILSNRSSKYNNNNKYHTLSLPRKLPPVKTLVSAFNDQINQQRLKQESRRCFRLREDQEEEDISQIQGDPQRRCNVYGTLPKKTKSNASFFYENNESSVSSYSTLRKYHSTSRKASSSSNSDYVILERDESEEILHHQVQNHKKEEEEEEKSSSGIVNETTALGGYNTLSRQSPSKEKTDPSSNDSSSFLSDMNASDLESWRRRQEMERLRVLQLGENVTPPKLPPKKPHLRGKGTFLLETDFDEVPIQPLSHSTTFKKPPAPSPPSCNNTPPALESDFSSRAYHRDSFMAHRREYTDEAEGIKESSSPTSQSFKKAPSSSASLGDSSIACAELDLSNLSLYSDWERSQHVGQQPLSMRLTSDAVKGIISGSKPPAVAPKPYNRSQSERLPKESHVHPIDNTSLSHHPPVSDLSSFNNVSNSAGGAIMLSSSSSSNTIHSSKSTPSLNSGEGQTLPRKFSQLMDNSARPNQGVSEILPSFQKWKRSMDSLDDKSAGNLLRPNRSSAPLPSEIRTSKSGTLAPSSNNATSLLLDSFSSDKPVTNHHHRTTSLDHSSSSNICSPPKHFHSNSDSGLSSLGGRTSTMSPVSTISSVSSGSSVSSRASLRSASIVSSSTLPGDAANLIEEEEDHIVDQEHTEERCSSLSTSLSHSSPPSSMPKMTGSHKVCNNKRNALQEETDCEKVFQQLIRSLSLTSEEKTNSIDGLQTLFFTSPYQKTLLDYVEGVLEIESNELCNTSLESNKSMKKGEPHMEQGSPKICRTSFGSLIEPNSILLGSNKDVGAIKVELLKKVDCKLNVLRSTQVSLKEGITQNEELGKHIAQEVKRFVSPVEYDKFDLHVQEMDKITNLLLGLSGRLARVENNLLALSIDGNRSDEIYRIRSEEGKLLLSKRDKLADQLSEAKKLKQNIDRRSNLVAKILRKNLSHEIHSQYLQYIKNKTRLILDSRDIYDKIKLGEEQVYALKTASFSN